MPRTPNVSKNRIQVMPPVPLPADEILRSADFMALDASGRGVLFSLLLLAWRDEGIPADPVVAARLAGVSQEVILAYWDSLRCWFMPHPVRPGHLFPPALLAPLMLLVQRRIKMASVSLRNPKRNAPVNADALRETLSQLVLLASKLGLKIDPRVLDSTAS